MLIRVHHTEWGEGIRTSSPDGQARVVFVELTPIRPEPGTGHCPPSPRAQGPYREESE